MLYDLFESVLLTVAYYESPSTPMVSSYPLAGYVYWLYSYYWIFFLYYSNVCREISNIVYTAIAIPIVFTLPKIIYFRSKSKHVVHKNSARIGKIKIEKIYQ